MSMNTPSSPNARIVDHDSWAFDEISRALRLGGVAAEHALQRLTALPYSQLADMIDGYRYDGMTGLLGQSEFKRIGDEIIANRGPEERWRLITTDLVNFKTAVNDFKGHPVGNEVLTLFGAGLVRALRYGREGSDFEDEPSAQSKERQKDGSVLVNVAGRLGGDEAGILLQGRKVQDLKTDRVHDIVLQSLIYPPLKDLLVEKGINGLGVRVSTAMVEASHKSLNDVMGSKADPKLHTMGVYSFIRNNKGVLVPVKGYLPMPRQK